MRRNRTDRRALQRHHLEANAVVVRQGDPERARLPAHLYDVSMDGVSCLLPTAPELGEFVAIELEAQDIQLKGRVRHVQPLEEEWYSVGFALVEHVTTEHIQRLSPGSLPAPVTDPNLAWLLEAWPKLPEPVQTTILGLAGNAK